MKRKYSDLPDARLVAYQADPSPIKRRAAADVLVERGNTTIFNSSLELCRSENPVLREQGATILGRLGYPDSPEGDADWETAYTLLHAMATRDPRAIVRAESLRALAYCGAAFSVLQDAAEQGSRDKSPTVRVFAAYLLGHLHPLPGVGETVLRLLRDADKDVRDWTAYAIYNQVTFHNKEAAAYDSPEIRDELLRLTKDSHDWVNYEAFRALGALREKRAAPLLLGELGHEDEIDYDMAQAAGRMGDPALIPALEKALERFGDDYRESIKNALEQLRAETSGQ